MWDFNTSCSWGSSGFVGPMPMACNLTWVSSERPVDSNLVASCCTFVRFSGFSLLNPGGGSGQVRLPAFALLAGLPYPLPFPVVL